MNHSRESEDNTIPIKPNPGDVYIIRDSVDKEDGKVLDTKVIRFSRPVIVLSAIGKIATVLPCTTKSRWEDTSYMVRLSPTKVSYVLLAQVKTVDISMLDHEMGKLKPHVFNDLRNAYVNFLNRTDNRDTIYRTVPLTHKLDIRIFHAWNVYSNKDFTKFFVILEANNRIYSIPAHVDNYHMRETMDYIEGSFASYDPEEISYVGRRRYVDDNYEPIGMELDSSTINLIIHRIKALYGIDIEKPRNYTNTFKIFSENFARVFRTESANVLKAISRIPDDVLLSDQFLNKESEYYKQFDTEFDLHILDTLKEFKDERVLKYIYLNRLDKVEDLFELPPSSINWLIDNFCGELCVLIADKYVDKLEVYDQNKIRIKKLFESKYSPETIDILNTLVTNAFNQG